MGQKWPLLIAFWCMPSIHFCIILDLITSVHKIIYVTHCPLWFLGRLQINYYYRFDAQKWFSLQLVFGQNEVVQSICTNLLSHYLCCWKWCQTSQTCDIIFSNVTSAFCSKTEALNLNVTSDFKLQVIIWSKLCMHSGKLPKEKSSFGRQKLLHPVGNHVAESVSSDRFIDTYVDTYGVG